MRNKRLDDNERTIKFLYEMYDIDAEHDNTDDEFRLQAFYELFLEDMQDSQENVKEAGLQALWFLRCGEPVDETKSKPPDLIDFNHDAKYLYSALLRKGIDLNEVSYIHWWTLNSHLCELPDGVTIGRLAYLRDRWNKNKLSKDEQAEAKRYGKQFHIKDDEQEEVKEFWNDRLPD